MANLLEPVILGGSIPLRNRVCMGSMTRNRCVDDGKPTESNCSYYAVRAKDGVGLVIAEGAFISPHGAEWPFAPVMYCQSHAQAWEKVTKAVHKEGGKIFFQLWHPGRIQHEDMPLLKATGYPVLAPSKVRAAGGKFRHLPGVPGDTENITEIEDPKVIVEQYTNSVILAKAASFDGIELLSQGGYLLHNFLCSHSNKRTDSYGGSAKNRCRFVLEVVDAISGVWGASHLGIKICPSDDYNDSVVSYEELTETYTYLIKELVSRELGYINLSRRGCEVGRDQDDYFKSKPRPKGMELPPNYEPLHQFGDMIKYPAEADKLVKKGKIDLVTFGRPFIYNPDLITRIRKVIPFAVNDRGGAVNYGPYRTVGENYNDWQSVSS